VPKSQRIYEENKGWDVAKYLLGHEREMISGMGLAASGRNALIDGAIATIGLDHEGRLADPVLRAQIALFEVRSKAFGYMSERFIDELKAKRAHPAQPSMMKYFGTELNKSRHELMMAAGGTDALEWESEASGGGSLPRSWLRTKGNSIEGGTSEVQLNIIAKRILELPS
jgi:alkylation response protein AidB-like acyl-CoA dehydrogenase